MLLFLLAYPVETARCDAAAVIQYVAEKIEKLNAEKILFASTIKPNRHLSSLYYTMHKYIMLFCSELFIQFKTLYLTLV